MAKIAYLRIDRTPTRRFDAFVQGLDIAGFMVSMKEPRQVRPGDVMVLWNRGGTNETYADCFEQGSGTTIIVENGYIGRDKDNNQLLAIAKHGHNGSGSWNTRSDEDRWASLNIQVQPWRTSGDHILVCPNRFIGSKEMRMPRDWAEQIVTELRTLTHRPIRVRPHPGNWQVVPPKISLSQDLKDAWATVIWSSTAGVHSLIAGIPVYYFAPHWICETCAVGPDEGGLEGGNIDEPLRMDDEDRMFTLRRMAWAQWRLSEIRSGEAFKCLLQT